MPEVKPGIKTTEFWVSCLTPILVPLIMSLVHKFGFPISQEAITGIVIASITTPITYVLGRFRHKNKSISDGGSK